MRRTAIVVMPLLLAAGVWLVFFSVGNKTGGGPANACLTEAQSFHTAVNAYGAATKGHMPAGADGLAIARTLASSGGGGPWLASTQLRYYDAANPPAAHRWTWDMATSSPVTGSHCADED